MDRMQSNIPMPPPLPASGNTREFKTELSHSSKDHFSSEDVSTAKRILRYLVSSLNLLHHMQAAVVVFFAIAYAVRNPAGVALQELHIILCVTGYQLILFKGIMALSKWNKTTVDLTLRGRKALHLFLQTTGFILIVSGISIQIYNRGGRFETPHGIFGLISLICIIFVSISGIPVLFTYRISIIKPTLVKFSHIILGVTAFAFGITTLCLGLNKDSFRGWSSNIVANTLIAFVTLTILYTLIWPFIHMYHYLRKSL